jgi:AcrR family transcriptional regulator
MSETRQKLLDTAERLFSEHGYAGTSLRQIIAEAGVNLAAIHYHFGSKDDLLDQVVMRRAGPVNEGRMALLDRFEKEAGGAPLPLEKVLEAFLAPTVQVADRTPEVVRLMGRLYGEDLMPKLITRHFQPMVSRFAEALRRTLPDLPGEELAWRIHFMIGAMAHTLAGPPGTRRSFAGESQEVVARLVAFLSGGFRAPLPPTVRKPEDQ